MSEIRYVKHRLQSVMPSGATEVFQCVGIVMPTNGNERAGYLNVRTGIEEHQKAVWHVDDVLKITLFEFIRDSKYWYMYPVVKERTRSDYYRVLNNISMKWTTAKSLITSVADSAIDIKDDESWDDKVDKAVVKYKNKKHIPQSQSVVRTYHNTSFKHDIYDLKSFIKRNNKKNGKNNSESGNGRRKRDGLKEKA